jgi:polyphosphate kinase
VPTEPLPADRFLDRELSWLAFNNRVLDLTKDKLRVPLLERAKFLAIFASNLDEFYMVRVAGLKRRIAAGVAVPGVSGMLPRDLHSAILSRTRELVAEQARVFTEEIRPELAAEGIEILRWDQLTADERDRMDELFAERIFPVLTPLAVDPSHPFPVHLRTVDQSRGPGAQSRDRHPAVRPGQGADRCCRGSSRWPRDATSPWRT